MLKASLLKKQEIHLKKNNKESKFFKENLLEIKND